jgi:CBS domain-containing protein
MEARVATALSTDRLDRVAEQMRARDFCCVVVVDEARRGVGIVTDRDVCMAALRTGRALSGMRAGEAMSVRLVACRSNDSVDSAESLMSLHQVRRLVVLDDQGQVCGLLSLEDIARAACRAEDPISTPVSCAAVGRTLGQIARVRVLLGVDARRGPDQSGAT